MENRRLDTYSKAVLTIIAVCLVQLCVGRKQFAAEASLILVERSPLSTEPLPNLRLQPHRQRQRHLPGMREAMRT